MSLSGIKKGIYDELYVTNGQTLTRIDGSGGYDDTQVQTDIAQLELDVAALETDKQDSFAVNQMAAPNVQLLKNGVLRNIRGHPDNSILIYESSGNISIQAPPDSSKQDALTVAAPLTLSGGSLDFNRDPITGGVDMGSVVKAGNGIFQTANIDILQGQAVATINSTYAPISTVADISQLQTDVATKEPAFQTTSDLVKITNLNVSPATIDLGLHPTFRTRVDNIEDTANNAEPAFVTTSDLQKTLNLQNATIELGISSAFENRIAAIEAQLAARPLIHADQFYVSPNLTGVNMWTVNFPTNLFSQVPKVVVGQAYGNSSGHLSINRIYVQAVYTTHFELVVDDTSNSNNFAVDYVAIQM